MARRDYDPARRGSGEKDLEFDESQQGLDECCPDCGSWSHASCASKGRRPGFGAAILGIGVVAVGIILLLDNLGIMESENVIDFWPMLLVLVGLSHFLRPKGSRRYVAGSIFIFIGVIIQLSNLGYIRYDIFDLWPVILVIAGISLILKPFRRRGVSIGEDTGVFEATAILGGSSRKLSAANFQGGDAVAIMGGCDIDLRDCGSEGGPAEIDTFAFWGGIEIKVPEDWEVQVKGLAILGGYGDETRSIEGDGHKVLVVTGTAIMGGVDIKN
jgi:predicted membrane protein